MSLRDPAPTVEFLVNGRPARFAGSPMTRLLDVLRESLALTGAKEGCGEGECGACSVLLDGEVVCACLVPIFQCRDRHVRTVEALGELKGGGLGEEPGEGLDPLQEAFVREGGVQCGACTPGILLTLQAMRERGEPMDRPNLRRRLGGNLCRCTGYEAIYRSVKRASGAVGKRASGPKGERAAGGEQEPAP